jgi:hypothetical protein
VAPAAQAGVERAAESPPQAVEQAERRPGPAPGGSATKSRPHTTKLTCLYLHRQDSGRGLVSITARHGSFRQLADAAEELREASDGSLPFSRDATARQPHTIMVWRGIDPAKPSKRSAHVVDNSSYRRTVSDASAGEQELLVCVHAPNLNSAALEALLRTHQRARGVKVDREVAARPALAAREARGGQASTTGRSTQPGAHLADPDTTAGSLHTEAMQARAEATNAEHLGFVDDSEVLRGREPKGSATAEQVASAVAQLRAAAASRAELELKLPPVMADREQRRVVEENMQELFDERNNHPQIPREDFGKVMREIREGSLNVEEFRPGTLRLHLAGHEALFTMCHTLGLQRHGVDSRGHTRTQREVLKMLTGKPKYLRRHIRNGETGRKRAVFRKKRDIVRNDYVKGCGLSEAEADRVLSEPNSPDLYMPNRASCYTAENFQETVKGLVKMILAGALVFWEDLPEHVRRGRKRPPRTCALSLARRARDNKARLCSDEMSENLWMEDLPMRMDSIEDVISFVADLEAAGHKVVIGISDEANCYWHNETHEDDILCHCVEFCGMYLACLVQPFGAKQAGYISVKTGDERERPLRLMGYALGKYIDDAAKVRKSPGHALWVDVRYFRIMRALGVYYGWGNMIEDPETRLPLFSKVELLASRCKSYIGFQIDLDRRELRVPDDGPDSKLQRMLDDGEAILATYGEGPLPPRVNASYGGTIAAVAPALMVAREFAGLCSLALRGMVSWEEALADGAATRACIQLMNDHARELNGTRYLAPLRRIRLGGDYSPQGIAAVIDGGADLRAELHDGHHTPCWRSEAIVVPPGTATPDDGDLVVVGTHTADDLALISSGKMSSALGESRVLERVLDDMLAHLPDNAIRGFEVVYDTDAQAIEGAFTRGYSPVLSLHRSLLNCRLMLARRGARLVLVWRSRETPGGRLADWLGKQVDSTAWRLHRRAYAQVVAACAVQDRWQRVPTIDAAADEDNYLCDIYVSRFHCPGDGGEATGGRRASSAVDFRMQGAWLAKAKQADGRTRLSVWNPPFALMADVIRLVRDYTLDCVLIYPLWARPWVTALKALPAVSEPTKLDECGAQLFTRPAHQQPKEGAAGQRKWGAAFMLVNWTDQQRSEATALRKERWAAA